MLGSWLRYHSVPYSLQTMELSKSFPPADALIETLQQIDYSKLYHTFKDIVITSAAFVAVVAVLIWNFVKSLKFSTPYNIANYFYFAVNFVADSGDEIVGLSVGQRYIGLYHNGIAWGILNAEGALDG
jgi:hypothetical protein